jgi:hypothetical protein
MPPGTLIAKWERFLRVRGWTCLREATGRDHTVLPVHAGMDLRCGSRVRVLASASCVRGDGPLVDNRAAELG